MRILLAVVYFVVAFLITRSGKRPILGWCLLILGLIVAAFMVPVP